MSSESTTDNVEQTKPSEVAESSAPDLVPAVSFKYWNPPKSGATAPRAQDLPDSYFEPSLLELKAAFAAQQKQREQLNNAPLKSQAMRQAEEKTKLSRWPTCTIRVKFPDLSQLETTFPSSDKIRSVYAFVRNSLREDIKPYKFVLYQAPPRREFKVSDPEVKNQTLAQLSLAPSSILMLSFLDDDLNNPVLRAPLTAEILAQAQDLPLPPQLDPPASSKAGNKPQSQSFGLPKFDASKYAAHEASEK